MTRLRFSAHIAVVVALLTAALPLPASAQNTAAAPTCARVTINAVHSSAVDVADMSGNKAIVTLSVDIDVMQIMPIESSAIRAGSYTGTTAVRESDSMLCMLEVHVFPEAMHGTGDDHCPYDLGPNGSTTNGTTEQAGAVTGAQGRTLSAKHKDGEQCIVVPPQMPIVTFEPDRRDDLKAGAYVVVFVRVDAQGTLTAQRALAGKDRTVPPM